MLHDARDRAEMNFAAHVQKPVIGAAFPQGKQVKEGWVNGFSPSDGLER
jgi:hypothetical protein